MHTPTTRRRFPSAAVALAIATLGAAGAFHPAAAASDVSPTPADLTTAAVEQLRPLPPVRTPEATMPGSSIRETTGCVPLHNRLDTLRTQWQSAVDRDDVHTANGIRVEYANVAASYYQCMYAGNLLAIDPLGSSMTRYQPGAMQ